VNPKENSPKIIAPPASISSILRLSYISFLLFHSVVPAVRFLVSSIQTTHCPFAAADPKLTMYEQITTASLGAALFILRNQSLQTSLGRRVAYIFVIKNLFSFVVVVHQFYFREWTPRAAEPGCIEERAYAGVGLFVYILWSCLGLSSLNVSELHPVEEQ
jgi:hypothetical protein